MGVHDVRHAWHLENMGCNKLMENSRNISDLLPSAATKCEAFINACKSHGIDVIITSTYRDNESQDALYAEGRTAPGSIVTHARAGQSYHNYRVAFDFCPVVGGKTRWDDLDTFRKCGEIGEQCGLEWAGRWEHMREYAHLQLAGLKLADLQAGHLPQE